MFKYSFGYRNEYSKSKIIELKKMIAGLGITLTNNEIKDIIKVIKCPENSRILLK